MTLTVTYILFENMLTKNDLAYKYYFNLVEAIIRHQKLHLTCRELRSSCTACTSNRQLLTSGVIFAVNTSFMLTSKNVSWKIRHKNIFRMKTLQNEHWTSSKRYCFFFLKKRVEALDELENAYNKGKNQMVKM